MPIELEPRRMYLHRAITSTHDSSSFTATSTNTIASESGQEISPAWDASIEALWKCRDNCGQLNESDYPRPSKSAIQAAIAWLVFLKRQNTQLIPSFVAPSPEGGIIVDRCYTSPGGHDHVSEMIFLNDGSAEKTEYIDGKIKSMQPIPMLPPTNMHREQTASINC